MSARERKLSSNRKAARKCRAKKRLYTNSMEKLSALVTNLLNSGYDGLYADELVDAMNDVRVYKKAGKRGRPRKDELSPEKDITDHESEDEEKPEESCNSSYFQTEMLSFII